MGDSKVFEKIFSSQIDRENYTITSGYTNYFISYIGLEDEDLYNLEIFKTKYNIDNRKDIALFSSSLPNPSDFDMINYFKNKLSNYRNSLEHMDIRIISNEKINNKIKRSFDMVLKEEEKQFNNERVKENFIIKVMSWIKTYVEPLTINKDDAPKIIFYGEIKKHEAYLLAILYLAGFDVLYLNPNSSSNIVVLNKNLYKIEEIIKENVEDMLAFEERVALGEKVNKGSIKKAMTIGAQASQRISNELLNESGFIKPWQLQDRKIKNVLLTSTMEEISIYWNQPLKLRPSFNFDNNYIEVSVFFSKINGVYNDRHEYRNFVKILKGPREYVNFIDLKNGFEQLAKPFTNDAFSLSFILDSKGIIDKKSVLQEKSYSISTLSKPQQTMILEKVEEIIASNVFIDELNREDRIKGLFTVLNMDKKLVHMINNFDYALINPKLVIYMKEAVVFNKEIGFLLLLLSKIGFDIIMLSPGGDNCIENVISSKVIDIHRLDKMIYQFDLDEKEEEEKSIFKKLFSKRGLF
ncbi:YceG family protein [Terrisporobacter glycolicus]|nr:YceG family protein [Terrisporobacter glycolicus]